MVMPEAPTTTGITGGIFSDFIDDEWGDGF